MISITKPYEIIIVESVGNYGCWHTKLQSKGESISFNAENVMTKSLMNYGFTLKDYIDDIFESKSVLVLDCLISFQIIVSQKNYEKISKYF